MQLLGSSTCPLLAAIGCCCRWRRSVLLLLLLACCRVEPRLEGWVQRRVSLEVPPVLCMPLRVGLHNPVLQSRGGGA